MRVNYSNTRTWWSVCCDKYASRTYGPLTLRALDGIHLATALSLEPDIDGRVVYDPRLAAAARAAGLRVWAPS
jgi:uncharacterized protein